MARAVSPYSANGGWLPANDGLTARLTAAGELSSVNSGNLERLNSSADISDMATL